MEETVVLADVPADKGPFEAWEIIDDTLDGLERHFRVTNAIFLEKLAKMREELRIARLVFDLPSQNE